MNLKGVHVLLKGMCLHEFKREPYGSNDYWIGLHSFGGRINIVEADYRFGQRTAEHFSAPEAPEQPQTPNPQPWP